MRKLASVQQIQTLTPIINADRIECASVLGWTVVVNKGEFAVGDRCVFFEVDALLPEAPWSEFMREAKFRVKTCKKRGQISQGLALPLSVFADVEGISDSIPEATDVSLVLGVTKYEPPEASGGTLLGTGPFPGFIPKTDEERVQSAPHLLAALQGRPYVITVKLDGSSMTASWTPDEEFVVCSRNNRLDPDGAGKYGMVATRLKLKEALEGTSWALQGELCGPGIQKNRLGLKESSFFVFNAFDWKTGNYVSHHDLMDFCAAHSIPTVPEEEQGASFDCSQEDLLAKAEGCYKDTPNRREGIVIKTLGSGPRFSFKAISNQFLLKDED